jgi:hypothetical protein
MVMFRRRRWPWAVAAVAVLALGAGGYVATQDDPKPAAAPRDPEIVETAEPVPDPTLASVSFDALLGPDIAAHDGEQVSASGAPVQFVVGPSAVWVGPSAERRVLVVIVGTGQTFDGVAGARLSFTGVVTRSTLTFVRELGISGEDEATYRRQGAYVEVTAYERA